MQVSAECVCTCPYLLAVPLRALNTKGSGFAMRFTLHQGCLPHQGTILEDCGASMEAIAMHVCHRECGDAVQDQVMTM